MTESASSVAPAPPAEPPAGQQKEAKVIKQKRVERAARRAQKKAGEQRDEAVKVQQAAARFKAREWAQIKTATPEQLSLSLFSWNVRLFPYLLHLDHGCSILAQALVRRELFPGSDFLKVKERVPTIMQEFLHYSPDIACLQEVDRLEDHSAAFQEAYNHTYYKGYANKAHGLLILHNRRKLRKVAERGIRLDEVPLQKEASTKWQPPSGMDETDDAAPANPESRRQFGISRSTRNVALYVALESIDKPGKGLIVATTHLFWHPKHAYERVRQTALLVREAYRFRDSDDRTRHWPVILAGDFNSQPREAAYKVLVGAELDDDLRSEILNSAVVHTSVDKLHGTEDKIEESNATAKEDEEQDPDKVITNARPATESDGLASVEQLTAMFEDLIASRGKARSAYGEAYGLVEGEDARQYWTRPPQVASGAADEQPEVVTEAELERRKSISWEERIRRGDFEPIHTNYTPLWRCTLDYIMVLPGPGADDIEFTSLLKLHKFEDLKKGLPLMGVSPSDHMAIACGIAF